RDSGIYAVYGGMPEGEQCIANIEKFLSIARGEQEKGFLSLDSFVAGITLATENDLSEGEARIDTETGDAVNIMTVHASKGLEFPVVILPDMASGMTADASSILIGERYGVGVKIPDPENAYELSDSAMLTILRHENNEKLRAEKKRLFYVACTRAKDHLILCGTEPKEFKQDLSACKNRIDWTCCCLHLTYDLLDSGYAIVTVPGAGEIRVKITGDPDNIRAEIRVPAPELITVPEVGAGTEVEVSGVGENVPLHETHNGIDTPGPGHSHSHPAEKRSFTVSEIELFCKSPEKYEMIYRKKRPERPFASPPGISRPDIRGTVIHRVFEGKDPAVVLLSYGIRDEKQERELQQLYETFLSTDMMQSAVESHCEVPFSGEIEGVRLSGKIDRVVKIADGKWFVIDYKTDEIRESGRAGEGMPEVGEEGGNGHYEEKKAEKYLLQMAVYATAAERILGVPVTPLLYFTKTGRFVKTPRSDTEREEVLKRMRDTVDEMVETEKRE
ncbi:MAG: PD-(D/E)XK nuclease family protein, partial [Methanogenium sp.]|nr:PD-(D/E)XK nuclease family protein [Methanogenium sp.]